MTKTRISTSPLAPAKPGGNHPGMPQTAHALIDRAYRRFARQHPRWAESLFDAHFLHTHAAPLLGRRIAEGRAVAAAELASAWVAQLAWPGALRRVDLDDLLRASADFLSYLDAELVAGGDHTPMEHAPRHADPTELGHVLAVYAEALHSGCNYALDWLWLAAKLPHPADRRFCIARALAIDPESSLARHALAQLAAEERRGNVSRLACQEVTRSR